MNASWRRERRPLSLRTPSPSFLNHKCVCVFNCKMKFLLARSAEQNKAREADEMWMHEMRNGARENRHVTRHAVPHPQNTVFNKKRWVEHRFFLDKEKN